MEVLDAFQDALGLDIPILNDANGGVYDSYGATMAFPTGAYPQQFLVGVDGTIVYYGNSFEYEALVDVIEEELDKAE